MVTSWAGLFVAMGVLLLLARRSLPLAFFLSAVTLGIFTLPPMDIWMGIWNTVADPSILLLALAMGVIPMIGGVMEESEQMDKLVNNLRIGKRAFLILSPALMGMLPVPGGALLSSPLVQQVGEGITGKVKAAINVWFRHTLLMIYPLAPALIASAKIAGLEVYKAIPYLFPGFVVTSVIGWAFFLRDVEGEISYEGPPSIRNLLLPLGILLLAPTLDFLLPKIFAFDVLELATLIAVSCSLGLALLLSHLSRRDVRRITAGMAPWSFSMMIIGMFVFLNMFKASGMSELMASLAFSVPLLCLISFLLGIVTGRIHLPSSVVIPTYLSMMETNPMPVHVFALVFVSAALGYLMSPAHPCVSVSLEYFGADLGEYLKMTIPPALLGLILILAISLLV